MKFILFILLPTIAITLAYPLHEEVKSGTIPILQYEQVQDEFGQYAMRYVSGDGTKVSEQGSLKINSEGNGHVLTKQGTISYHAPDGTPITLEYIADENGFRPKGLHLPKVSWNSLPGK